MENLSTHWDRLASNPALTGRLAKMSENIGWYYSGTNSPEKLALKESIAIVLLDLLEEDCDELSPIDTIGNWFALASYEARDLLWELFRSTLAEHQPEEPQSVSPHDTEVIDLLERKKRKLEKQSRKKRKVKS